MGGDNNNQPEGNSQSSNDNESKNTKLDDVKTQAIQALAPLIDGLESLDPERKFDICLSAMRYTDDDNLAGSALKAALSIKEEGTKAEALVELINEINYLQAP